MRPAHIICKKCHWGKNEYETFKIEPGIAICPQCKKEYRLLNQAEHDKRRHDKN